MPRTTTCGQLPDVVAGARVSTACVGVVVDATSMEAITNSILDALLVSQRPQVPHLGGGGAHNVCHDAELRGAERVFSLLKTMFGDARTSSLADLIEGSLMLKFNKAKRESPRRKCWRSLLAQTY